jgi:hypothetical protein
LVNAFFCTIAAPNWLFQAVDRFPNSLGRTLVTPIASLP